MQIAVALDGHLTARDAIGPCRTLGGIPDAGVVFGAEGTGPVRDDSGRLALVADRIFGDVRGPDFAVAPGGPEPSTRTRNGPLLDWPRAVDPTTTWTTSVCTGSLARAAAGLLKGRTATSHWLAPERFERLGAHSTGRRVVFAGKDVTAAEVASGIGRGLALAGRIVGDETAQAIQLMTEYDPRPPYDAGSPERAPAHLVAMFRESRSS
ncbi:DJ-1/PfpI family protein [Streptomyces sp. VRA16 Mangrove soil]|uniref:DJ-1/PfpI family protein n=1 Tax=Streptomyces sp. VRA16 Mangrove soil TaxID=2817434 RepID=UPI001A9EE992|nr:DJ-1/PfpI family protein [Streptomyces sp. VRA16 Mangrove soil]MBO1329682.1 DJ-1/PfpI family protein [Streptomyces sp. VRA16 Mangrove soil]